MKQDDILNLEKRWLNLKKKYESDAYLQIPVPVIYAQASEDAEHITAELSDFVFEHKILQQISPRHEKYLIHSIAYVPQSENSFCGIQDLYNRIRNAGGYYGSYRGIFLIDVTEWQGHFTEKYFDIILSYLSDRRIDGIIPFFYMKFNDYNTESRILDAAVSSYFRSARIVLELSDLHDCMISELTEEGITIDNSTSCYLESFIHKASESALFHGTDTIHQICEEVVQRYKAKQDSTTILNGTLMRELLEASGYLDIFKEKEKIVMGFR